MNGQKLNFDRYKESLERTSEPTMPKDLPKVRMNLAGLSRYVKEKGVSIRELSIGEIQEFVPTYTA